MTAEQFERAANAMIEQTRAAMADVAGNIGEFLDSKVEAGQLDAATAEQCKADLEKRTNEVGKRCGDLMQFGRELLSDDDNQTEVTQ